jgi:hypothetical protein
MTEIKSLNIAFDVPPGWEHFSEGKQFVFQSPRGEELIVSGRRVSGPASGREAIIDRIFADAVDAAIVTANDAVLQVIAPLREIVAADGISIWRIDARSTDGEIAFSQAIVRHANGAALFTYEAPARLSSEQVFSTLLQSMRPAPA